MMVTIPYLYVKVLVFDCDFGLLIVLDPVTKALLEFLHVLPLLCLGLLQAFVQHLGMEGQS